MKKNKSTKHPMFPNEDTEVTCGRHPESSCTEAHDSHVAGLIQRDGEIVYLKRIISNAREEICELKEVLKMTTPQIGRRTTILRTEGGEEIDCLLIPKDEVESVLERYE